MEKIYGGYGDIASSAIKTTNISGGVVGTTFAQSAADTTAAVSPNTSATKKVYKMTGTGSSGSAPVWEQATIAENSDYAAGTFTPVLSFSVPGDLAVTYGDRVGTYVKIPGLCTIQIIITTSVFTYTTASGALQISGLPFTIANPGISSQYYGMGNISMRGYTNVLYTRVVPAGRIANTLLRFFGEGSGLTPTLLATTDVASGSTVTISLTLSFPI